MQRYSYLPTAVVRRENHAFRIKEQASARCARLMGFVRICQLTMDRACPPNRAVAVEASRPRLMPMPERVPHRTLR